MGKVCLIIMDGLGINEPSIPSERIDDCQSLITGTDTESMTDRMQTIISGVGASDDTVATSTDSRFRKIVGSYPHTLLYASGEAVGLPPYQMGNSEVGHLTIGAGRVIWQSLAMIDRQIESGEFRRNEVLVKAILRAKASALHIVGLCSDGGVHSHINHLFHLIDMASSSGVERIYIHFITDGRDTDIHKGLIFAETLVDYIEKNCYKIKPIIASVCGRYYAMDREGMIDRTKKAWTVISGRGKVTNRDITEVIKSSYENSISDEFVEPTQLADYQMKSSDCIIFFNLRADRMRQILNIAIEQKFLNLFSFTEYDNKFTRKVEVAFPKENIENTLSERVSKLGLVQLKVAETTKFAHVTYFLNGGREEPFVGEDRILVDSPNVATFDLQPKMSADEVARKVKNGMSKGYDLIVVNFANCDMVGHTANIPATEIAVSTVTSLVAGIVEMGKGLGYEFVITADHGNAEINLRGGVPITTHSTNRVPLVVVSNRVKHLRNGGSLCNICATVVELLEKIGNISDC